MLGSNCLIPSSHGGWTSGRMQDYPVLHFDAHTLSIGPQSLSDLHVRKADGPSVLFSPQGLPHMTSGAGISQVPSILPQGPLSSPQAPHLAPGQDLDSCLSPTEALSLIPGPQSLKDTDVRKSDHACFTHSIPLSPWTDNGDGLLRGAL